MGEAKEFVFSEGKSRSNVDSKTLDELMSPFLAGLELNLEQALAVPLSVSAGELKSITFDKWSTKLPNMTSLSVFQPESLAGAFVIGMDEQLVSTMLDIHLGGDVANSFKRNKPVFSHVELSLVDRFTQAMANQLMECFSRKTNAPAQRSAHEVNPTVLDICQNKDSVFLRTFTVSHGKKLKWKIEVLFTEPMVTSIIEKSEKDTLSGRKTCNNAWQSHWMKNLNNVRFPIRMVLAQPNMSLPKLLELRVGDMIPITPRVTPPLFVANRRFASATLGKKNGAAAFKIVEITKEKLGG